MWCVILIRTKSRISETRRAAQAGWEKEYKPVWKRQKMKCHRKLIAFWNYWYGMTSNQCVRDRKVWAYARMLELWLSLVFGQRAYLARVNTWIKIDFGPCQMLNVTASAIAKMIISLFSEKKSCSMHVCIRGSRWNSELWRKWWRVHRLIVVSWHRQIGTDIFWLNILVCNLVVWPFAAATLATTSATTHLIDDQISRANKPSK